MDNQQGVGLENMTGCGACCSTGLIKIRNLSAAALELMRACRLPDVRKIGIVWIFCLVVYNGDGFAIAAVETECPSDAGVIEVSTLVRDQRPIGPVAARIAVNGGQSRLLNSDLPPALLTQLLDGSESLCWLGGYITSRNGGGEGLVFTSNSNADVTVRSAVLAGFADAIVLDNLSTTFLLSGTKISESVNCVQLRGDWSRITISSSLLEGCLPVYFGDFGAGTGAAREFVLENSLIAFGEKSAGMDVRSETRMSVRMVGNIFVLTHRRDVAYVKWLEAQAGDCRDNTVILRSGDLGTDFDNRCLIVASGEMDWHQRRAAWMWSHQNDLAGLSENDLAGLSENDLAGLSENDLAGLGGVRAAASGASQPPYAGKVRRKRLRILKYGEFWSDNTAWSDGTGWD